MYMIGMAEINFPVLNCCIQIVSIIFFSIPCCILLLSYSIIGVKRMCSCAGFVQMFIECFCRWVRNVLLLLYRFRSHFLEDMNSSVLSTFPDWFPCLSFMLNIFLWISCTRPAFFILLFWIINKNYYFPYCFSIWKIISLQIEIVAE